MQKFIKDLKKALKKEMKNFYSEDKKFCLESGDLEQVNEIAETLRYMMIVDKKDEQYWAEKYPTASQLMDEIAGARSKIKLYAKTKDMFILKQVPDELAHAETYVAGAKAEMKTEKEKHWLENQLSEHAELVEKVKSLMATAV